MTTPTAEGGMTEDELRGYELVYHQNTTQQIATRRCIAEIRRLSAALGKAEFAKTATRMELNLALTTLWRIAGQPAGEITLAVARQAEAKVAALAPPEPQPPAPQPRCDLCGLLREQHNPEAGWRAHDFRSSDPSPAPQKASNRETSTALDYRYKSEPLDWTGDLTVKRVPPAPQGPDSFAALGAQVFHTAPALQKAEGPINDPLHPNGRCTCAGEGLCEWCIKTSDRESTDLQILDIAESELGDWGGNAVARCVSAIERALNAQPAAKEPSCSFCGKPSSVLRTLVSGNNAYICGECAALSARIHVEHEQPMAICVCAHSRETHAGGGCSGVHLGSSPRPCLCRAFEQRAGDGVTDTIPVRRVVIERCIKGLKPIAHAKPDSPLRWMLADLQRLLPSGGEE